MWEDSTSGRTSEYVTPAIIITFLFHVPARGVVLEQRSLPFSHAELAAPATRGVVVKEGERIRRYSTCCWRYRFATDWSVYSRNKRDAARNRAKGGEGAGREEGRGEEDGRVGADLSEGKEGETAVRWQRSQPTGDGIPVSLTPRVTVASANATIRSPGTDTLRVRNPQTFDFAYRFKTAAPTCRIRENGSDFRDRPMSEQTCKGRRILLSPLACLSSSRLSDYSFLSRLTARVPRA